MLKHHHRNKNTPLHLATAGEDVRLWQMPELSLHSVKNGTNANVVHCACSPSGQLVAYAHEESGINIASIHEDTLPIVEIPTQCEQSSVAFNGNSRYVVSGGEDCVINIWDIKTKSAKRTYKDHTNPITYCTFNYNDNLIASASDHGEVILTNVQSGLSTDPLYDPDDSQAVRSIGYSYFSRSLMATISDSGSLCLWDTKEKKLVKRFTDHKAPGTALSFSPLNDMLLCSTGLDKRLIFYDVSGRKTVKTINTEGPITCCDFYNDGCTVAAGSASGHIFLFDLRHGSTPTKVISAHKTAVRGVSFQKVPKESKKTRPIEDSKVPDQNTGEVDLFDPVSNPPLSRPPTQPPPIASVKPNIPVSKTSMLVNKHDPFSSTREENAANFSDIPPPVPTSDRPTLAPSNVFKVTPVNSMVSSGVLNMGMGSRENSMLALNRLVGMNKTPEQAQQSGTMSITSIPPKAAKLMGEDIFSPIQTDNTTKSSTLPRKLKASKQKSLGKPNKINNTDSVDGGDEPERPVYGRSKSGLSRLSILAKSMEDINSIKKPDKKDKEMENDVSDGKKGGGGLLTFKSPFKKKPKNQYNRHSDESETSSIDSLNMEEKFGTNLRSKKDRLSDRSNDSGGGSRYENDPRKISNGLGVTANPPINRQIDMSQLLTDIQSSLTTQTGELSKSPSVHSGEFVHIQKPNSTVSGGGGGTPKIFQFDTYSQHGGTDGGDNNSISDERLPQIMIDFMHKLIEEAKEEIMDANHRDIVNLQVEMIRQMEMQKEQMRGIQQHSMVSDLLLENERLRIENERLKTKY